MNNEVKHTPTPWVADENAINDNIGVEIALITSDMRTWEEDDANAAHIVKCVNLHDELVDALKDAVSGISYVRQKHGDLYGVGFDRVEMIANAALKKAGAL